MIYRLLRNLPVNFRIIGGFLLMVALPAFTIPPVLTDHNLLSERLCQVTDVETRADRLLLLSSKRIESSRVNLMRFLQNYLPSTQESLNDLAQASQLLTETQGLLIIPEQQTAVGTVISSLAAYESIIRRLAAAQQGKQNVEMGRLEYQALKAGNDIGLLIELIVRKNGDHIAAANRTADAKAKVSLQLMAAGYVGILLLGLVLASWVGRSITRPVAELRQGAESFRQGQTETVLPVVGTDELALLAQTFNQMGAELHHSQIELQDHALALEQELLERRKAEDELQNYRSHLEELVEKRTAELNKAVEQLQMDITERQRIEEALRESQQRMSLLEHNLPMGVIEWDMDFKVTAWNPAAARIFGYTREEALGQHASRFIPQELQPTINRMRQELLHQKSDFRSTNDNLTKDGRRITCDWYNSTLINDQGRPMGVASVVDDITERKRVEAELQQNLADLERFNRLVVGREGKMIQLKQEINELREQLGLKQRYKIVE